MKTLRAGRSIARWTMLLALPLVPACASDAPTAPTGHLILELRLPTTASAASSFHRSEPGVALLANVDSLRIRVFEVTLLLDQDSLAVGTVLADQSLSIDPDALEFEIALRVPEALEYGIIVEGIGQQTRPEYFEPTTHGLQFLGFAYRTAEQLDGGPVEISLLDIVPRPVVSPVGAGDLIEWAAPPTAVTDLSKHLQWTVQGDGEILAAVTTRSYTSSQRHQQYRVRIDLYEGLTSAFSEPTGGGLLP